MSKMKKLLKMKNKATDAMEWTKRDEKLQAALLNEDLDLADQYMTKKGVQPTKVNLQGLTTLHRVASEGKMVALKFLYEKDVDLSTLDFHGQTPLHCAAKAGQVDAVTVLLKIVPVCLTFQDHNDLLPLHHGAMGGSTDVARLLLNAGTEVDATDKVGRTSLFIAARLGNQALVKELLDHQADINHRDLDQKTALMFATEYDHLSVVDYLVKRGANVLLTDSAGHNALWYTEETKNKEVRDIIENAPSRLSWTLDATDSKPRGRNSPVPDSRDEVARFIPEPDDPAPPPRPKPPSRKTRAAPAPPAPKETPPAPPPGFGSQYSQEQLDKLEHAVVPMDEVQDAYDDIQIARVSETFELSKPSAILPSDNFGRFSPEAVAAVEALIEQSNSQVKPEDVPKSLTAPTVERMENYVVKELEEENECLNEEVRRVSVEKMKLQEKVTHLERRLSQSEVETQSAAPPVQGFTHSTILESLEEELAEAKDKITLDQEKITYLEGEVKVLQKQLDVDSKPEAERNANDSWNDSDDELFESEKEAKKKLGEAALVASLRSQIYSLEKELQEKESVKPEVMVEVQAVKSEPTIEKDIITIAQYSELQQAYDQDRQQMQGKIDDMMDENFFIRKQLATLKESEQQQPQHTRTYTDVEYQELHQLIDTIGITVKASDYGNYDSRGDMTMEEQLLRLQNYVELMGSMDTNLDKSDPSMLEAMTKKYERSKRDLARSREENESLLQSQEKRNSELEEILAQVENLQEIAQYSNELQKENDTLKEENQRLAEGEGGQDHKAMAALTMQLQQDNNDLQSDNRSLKSQLSDIETSLKQTLAQKEHGNIEVNPLEDENMSLKLEIEGLKRVMSKDTDTVSLASMPGDSDEARAKFAHLKRTISQQEETIFELMQQSTRDAQLRADYEQLQKESEVLNSSMVDFQSVMANKGLEAEHQIKALEKNIMSLEDENRSLLLAQQPSVQQSNFSREKELSDRIVDLNAAIDHLENENQTLQLESSREDDRRISQFNVAIASLENENQSLKSNSMLEIERVAELHETIDHLENQNKALRSNSHREAELDDRILELLATINLLEEENKNLIDDVYKLEIGSQKIPSLQQERDTWEEEKFALQRKLNEAQENAKLWSVKVEGYEMENDSLKHDKDRFLKDITHWQEEALSLQAEVSEAAKDRIALKHIQDEYNAIRDQNKNLERNLQELEAETLGDASYNELKAKVRELEEQLESEQNATVMAILDGRTAEQKNTEASLKDHVLELTKDNERLKRELEASFYHQPNGNIEHIEVVATHAVLQAAAPDTNAKPGHRLGNSLKRRSEEMRLKELEEENDRLKTELEKFRDSPNPMQFTAANHHMMQLQEKLEQMEKRHRDVVSTYRTHLLHAVQGRMDQGVSQALKHIIKIRMSPEVDV